MDLGEAVIVAGVGCRKAISAAQVESAIEAALLHNRLAAHRLGRVAVPAGKGAESGLVAAAAARGVPPGLIAPKPSEAADPRPVTPLAGSTGPLHLGSASEGAALAARRAH